VRDYCYKNGMIMRNNGDILVMAPALIITREQIDDALRILDAALTEAERTLGA
jgi:adenosylmethionine-8-amino-7-oxononanoate aminotransferase